MIDVHLCRSILTYLGEIERDILEDNREGALNSVRFLKKEIAGLIEGREPDHEPRREKK